jgi:hypothetical protein
MSQNSNRDRFLHEGLITALAAGGFLIILGLVFTLTPGITDKTTTFFRDLTNVTRNLGSSTINLPAPAHPAEHLDFYTAVTNFLLGVGILQIVILALRLAVHSRVRRIAETVGNLIFWLGTAVAAKRFPFDRNIEWLVPVLVRINRANRRIPGCKVLCVPHEKK